MQASGGAPRKTGIETYTNASKRTDSAQAESSESKTAEQPALDSRRYSLNEVSLKFSFNQDTDELTVFVVDKTSSKVIRTIPPEEITKLDIGDLLEIAA